MRDAMYVAQAGGGATRNGSALQSASPWPAGDDPGRMTGAVLTRFLDAETAARVEVNRHRFASVTPGRLCAGVDYPDVVEGGQHFVLFWRTLPWDHAPGVLLVREAGGRAGRLDGSEYQPSQPGTGLLVASDQQTWRTVRTTLLGDAALATE
jgi:fructose-1,6-bisphosphatase/inositol monophosphatase family enzyme